MEKRGGRGEGKEMRIDLDPSHRLETNPISLPFFPSPGPGGHWCSNSVAANGRPHKSNYAYYRVDLATGAIEQRCFDGECGGVRCGVGVLPREYVYVPPPEAEGGVEGGEAA